MVMVTLLKAPTSSSGFSSGQLRARSSCCSRNPAKIKMMTRTMTMTMIVTKMMTMTMMVTKMMTMTMMKMVMVVVVMPMSIDEVAHASTWWPEPCHGHDHDDDHDHDSDHDHDCDQDEYRWGGTCKHPLSHLSTTFSSDRRDIVQKLNWKKRKILSSCRTGRESRYWYQSEKLICPKEKYIVNIIKRSMIMFFLDFFKDADQETIFLGNILLIRLWRKIIRRIARMWTIEIVSDNQSLVGKRQFLNLAQGKPLPSS